MPTSVLSATTLGIDAYPVHVEVDTDRQLPTFAVVGLPDNTVRESKERVQAAIRNAGYSLLKFGQLAALPGGLIRDES